MNDIMIAVGHDILRHGLQRLIEEDFCMRVVFSVGSGKSAARYCRKGQKLDAAIIDMSLKDLDGLECIARINELQPKLPILIFSQYDRPQLALRAFESGAIGFLTQEADLTDFFLAIRRVANGQRYLSMALQEAIAMATAEGMNIGNRLSSLSKREFQVMVKLAQGETNQ